MRPSLMWMTQLETRFQDAGMKFRSILATKSRAVQKSPPSLYRLAQLRHSSNSEKLENCLLNQRGESQDPILLTELYLLINMGYPFLTQIYPTLSSADLSQNMDQSHKQENGVTVRTVTFSQNAILISPTMDILMRIRMYLTSIH